MYCNTVHSQARHLLIIACSQRKRLDDGLLPAIARYDGPTFRLLRRFLQQQPLESLDIYILSAEFGLVWQEYLIPYYDHKMTNKRARELQPEVIAKLKYTFNITSYEKVCICVGKNYFKALDGYDKLITSTSSVQIATGSLGKKLFHLYAWLYGNPPENSHAHLEKNAVLGKACLKGIEVEMTSAEVIDIARRALEDKKGNPNSYQSWYVLVDGKRVSPKWLVSQLTKLPVSKFHSIAARRMLIQLGVKVSCL